MAWRRRRKTTKRLAKPAPAPEGNGPRRTELPDGTVEEVGAMGRSVIEPAKPRTRGVDFGPDAPGWTRLR
jgi:hypothetical protein